MGQLEDIMQPLLNVVPSGQKAVVNRKDAPLEVGAFLEGAVAGRAEEPSRGAPAPSHRCSPAAHGAPASATLAPREEARAPPPAEEDGHGAAALEEGAEDAGEATAVGDGKTSTLSFISKIKHRFEATEKILKAL